MNAIVPTVPARILKRADVSAELAQPLAPEPVFPSAVAGRIGAAPQRHVTKEARLVPGAPGFAAVEVRCSCGEWTRIELSLGAGKTAEEQR